MAALVRIACDIQQKLIVTTNENAVLMHVELQAVIQMLLQHLATHLNPKGSHGISDYQLVLEDLNKLVYTTSIFTPMFTFHIILLESWIVQLIWEVQFPISMVW